MEKIELDISDYGYSGEGVGRFNNKVCFVPYTIKGERVLARVEQQRNGYIKCQPIAITTKSPSRLLPPCPYFAKCGGCAFQHIDKQTELEIKKMLLWRQLNKIGVQQNIEVCPSPKEYFYRNKIKLFVDENDNLALCKQDSRQKVAIQKCLLVNDKINEVIPQLQTFLKAKAIGRDVQSITVRSQGEFVLVWFVFKRKIKLDFSGLQIMFGAKSGIFASVGNEKPKHISGQNSLVCDEFGLQCEFAVDAFHQVNNEVAQTLYQTVAGLAKGQKVINAYSGAGVLSAILAKKAGLVYGVELGVAEHKSAQQLKEKNDIKNLFNIQGDCAIHIPILAAQGVDAIVLDPPRSGVDKVVCQAINDSQIKQVVYISCDSASLARDVQRLDNYYVQKVELFDMFSRTSASETLCVLLRR